MQIKTRTFNALSAIVGIALTAAVAHNMATNPRWAGDNGPGVGKMPREVVAGFMKMAYEEGKGAQALALYTTSKTIDLAPDAADRKDGAPIKHSVRRVVAEGLNVVVWHCIDGSTGQSMETVDFFRTRDGRIVDRARPSSQALPAGKTCDQVSWPKPSK
ncbi:hypothetical protein G7047_06700 [Diaphorobacter sp. HDW4A]|uniref:hypothetical protein n=1 Tax=Diaphorobacter sp. HDW4A TaxID=2714924 RepID=UPI00140D0271|nr:hypothetical protein [Diaphorobacter sp. HDW4A]QIL79623.1 hypothetical protein G7047_06700 [Diaphorobacter sp. HDW4A]